MRKRAAKRHLVQLQVIELNGEPVTDTFLLDLSVHGARLESSSPLIADYRASLSFFLPGEETKTEVLGEVRWVHPLHHSPGRYQMGLKFDNPLWELDKLIHEGMV